MTEDDQLVCAICDCEIDSETAERIVLGLVEGSDGLPVPVLLLVCEVCKARRDAE